jgi:hypothetical protein
MGIVVSSLLPEVPVKPLFGAIVPGVIGHFDVPKKFPVGLLTSKHKAMPDRAL